MKLSTLCKKLMCILNHRTLSLDEARRSLLAIAKKASTQRSIGAKSGFKMRINLLHSVLRLILFLGLSIVFVFGCSNSKNNTDSMDTETSETIQVIAHRGGAKLAPENTIAAFKKAISLGVEMIEIDVILSKDSAVIVIHDDTIDRTTDGSGVVKEMTLEEIRQYDAGSWFDEKFAGEIVPTLDEVFETINGQCILLIEIKDGDEEYPGLERKVVDAIHKYEANDWVVVQSFNEQSVLRVKKMDPSLITYYLLGGNFEPFYAKLKSSPESADLPYDGIAVSHAAINSDNSEVIKKAGYSLFVWTVNKPEDMERLMKTSVDGIITDLPDNLQVLMRE